MGFDFRSCGIITALDRQSADIAMGVDADGKKDEGAGAGDQGMMFGFACNETDALMPMPIHLARSLVNRLRQVRERGEIPYLRPDGKAQVTVEYDGLRPSRVHTVVVSTQHAPSAGLEQVRRDVEEQIIRRAVPTDLLDGETVFHINPTGRFVEGGPKADSGLTGRKVVVDTYGGMGRSGGGAFSGKDPTKVDRSAAYAARHAAKNVVAAGLANRCEVSLAYAIGVARPVAVQVQTFGTSTAPEERISQAVSRAFDFRPSAIMEDYELRRPIYMRTAREGHFGIEHAEATWEKRDKVEKLRDLVKTL
jgi:S-adenosylmethionine synthetase